jgi:hypothetical protein
MLEHSPRAFPLGAEPPVGAHHVKGKPRPKARGRRPRPRICLRKGCGQKYHPRSWNQRYCQELECRRQVHRWQAARRQAKHRQDDTAKARHAHAERERRQRARLAPQTVQDPEVAPARGHVSESFFLLPYATGQDAMKHLRTRPATRLASAATRVARPFVVSKIVSASGDLAAPWMDARSGRLNIKPFVGSACYDVAAAPIFHNCERLRSDQATREHRSSIIA